MLQNLTSNLFIHSGLPRTLEVERHEMNCERRAGWISPAKRGNLKADFGGKPDFKFHNGRMSQSSLPKLINHIQSHFLFASIARLY